MMQTHPCQREPVVADEVARQTGGGPPLKPPRHERSPTHARDQPPAQPRDAMGVTVAQWRLKDVDGPVLGQRAQMPLVEASLAPRQAPP